MFAVRGGAAIMVLLLAACGGGGGADSADAPRATEATASPASTAASTPRETDVPDATPVTFDGRDLTLAGDLRLPDGRGPHPGIVLVGGSGPSSRDGVVPGQLAMTFPQPVTVLADLAAALRDAGYAVLTYDKRTCGPFNDCADNGYPTPADDLSIEAFVDDATAAVAYLRSRSDVRSDSVAIAGHSQGASFVPGMLLDDTRLVAGVMVSAPYEPVDALLTAQAQTVARIVADLDSAPPAAAASVTQLRQLARSVSNLRSGGGADDTTQLGGASVGFWRSWLRLSDGVPQLAQQARQPVLVLNGGADTNVGRDQTARWQQSLTDDRDRVVELDCVSHALNCLGTDDPLTIDPGAIEPTVDARVAQTIADFLDPVLR